MFFGKYPMNEINLMTFYVKVCKDTLISTETTYTINVTHVSVDPGIRETKIKYN